MLWGWISRSMDWSKLTRWTYNYPHETRTWHFDLILRIYYVRPIKEHLNRRVMSC